MAEMKTAVVADGRGGDCARQLRQLYAFAAENGIGAELSVIVSDGPAAEREALASVWTGKAVVVRLGASCGETAAEALREPLEGYQAVLFADGVFGTEVSCLLACVLHGCHMSRLLSLRARGDGASCSRMVYSNLACADYEVEFPLVCTVSAVPAASLPAGSGEPALTVLDRTGLPAPKEVLWRQERRSGEKSGVEDAKAVFVFGRGASKEVLEAGVELAKSLKAEYGVTKPVAMNGWAPLSRIVGVSGLQIHPDICVVLGASGAGAFYAGIEHSAFVVNVNTDSSEDLRDRSDVLVVGDCGEVVAAMKEACGGENSK